MRRRPPQTLEELIEHNYTIYTLPNGLTGLLFGEPSPYSSDMFQNYKG